MSKLNWQPHNCPTFVLMDTISAPQVHSRFPDCVEMKLHIKAISDVSATLPFYQAEPAIRSNEMNLSLSINFSGEQEIKVPGGTRLGLPGGRATFGIRRGQLRLVFQNCMLPLEKVALSKPFKVSMEVEKQETKSSEIQAGAALDARSVGAKANRGSAEKITVEVFQVKKIGSESEPAWVFEVYDDCIVLEGTLMETLLGVLQVVGLPCEMSANFTVRGDDIRITWGKIGRVQNISRNKLAVIERAIALRYIKPMVEKDPICQGRWQHD